jgi:hypothetical protein
MGNQESARIQGEIRTRDKRVTGQRGPGISPSEKTKDQGLLPMSPAPQTTDQGPGTKDQGRTRDQGRT